MTPVTSPSCWLPESPRIPAALLTAVRDDYERFAVSGLPAPLEEYLADRYRLDVATQYAGHEIRNPWGKASGQLSMTARQVAEDVEAGLGFVVLKTVIAQDEAGARTMQDWAIREARMLVEPIVGRSGERGWTVSWKGRGWWQPFDEYLGLVREARQIARGSGTLIIPSCKYHLPNPGEAEWKTTEYEHTTRRLYEAWSAQRVSGEWSVVSGLRRWDHSPLHHSQHTSSAPMPLEKDFSPTLAGSDRAAAQEKILEWLRTVPQLVARAADSLVVAALVRRSSSDSNARQVGRLQTASTGDLPVRLGLKLFNALFDDEFQLEMLRTIHQPGEGRPDFFVYGNRLFDPDREFDGRRGIAYGGPDLSDRNLRVMTRFHEAARRGEISRPLLDWSATGNITSGRMALEYALRGAGSFQLHTFFQLPADQYRMKRGSRVEKALHELYFHPETGLIVWMHHLAAVFGLPNEPIRLHDLVGRGGPFHVVSGES